MYQNGWRRRRVALMMASTVVAVPVLSLLISQISQAGGGTIGTGDCQTAVSETTTVSVALVNGKCVYTFAAGTTSITPPAGSNRVDFLVVGGGGGGGSNRGGGGGAGGFYESNWNYTSGTIDVTVGSGGAGGTTPVNNIGVAGSDGAQSTISGGGASFAAGGGGGGGAHNVAGAEPGRNGVAIVGGHTGPTGSGGGASMNYSTFTFAGGTGYIGSDGFANAGGGSGNVAEPLRNSGGGGGAGSAGTRGDGGNCSATTGTTPAGGTGRASSITGTSVTYAAGGGGSDARKADEVCGGTGAIIVSSAGAGSGGSGIGGAGAAADVVGGNAAAATGSGGGAGGANAAGGGGSAGIVILSIDATKAVSSGTTATTVLPKASNTVTVAYSATDTNSVASVAVFYSLSADLSSPTSCGSATGLSGTSVSGNITCTVPSSPTTTRTYFLYTIATDASGVVEDVPVSADDSFVHDGVTPLSTPSFGRTGSNTASIALGYSATDAGGLASITAYYSTLANLSNPVSCGTVNISGTSINGTVTCTLVSPTNGSTYYLYTVATDVAGQAEAVADYGTGVAIKYDTTNPSVSFGPGFGARVKSTGSITYRSNEAGTVYIVKSSVNVTSESSITSLADNEFNSGVIATWSVDYTIAATGLSEGDYKLYVADGAGNLSNAYPYTFAVDDTAPAQPTSGRVAAFSDLGFSDSDGITNTATPSVYAVLWESNGSVTFTAVQGGTTRTCTSPRNAANNGGSDTFCAFATLPAGTWTVTAVHTDDAGNASVTSASFTMVIDLTAPTAPTGADLLASSDWGNSSTDNTTAAVSPQFAVTGTLESAGQVNLRMRQNLSTVSTCSYLMSDSTLSCVLYAPADGLTNIEGTFTDAAGNVSAFSPTLAVIIDRVAPTLTTSALNSVYGVTESLSGSSNEVGRLYVVENYAASTWPDLAGLADNKQNFVTLSFANSSASVPLTGLAESTGFSLVVTDVAGNISSGSATSFVIDATAPTIQRVYGTDGAYKAGTTVNVVVQFSEVVNVTGSPYIGMSATGTANATYASGSGTSLLTFTLTVSATNNAADLNYSSTTSLVLGSATIRDVNKNNAVTTLPALNSPESLASQSNIRLDSAAPTVAVTNPSTPTNAPTVVYRYTFAESVTGIIASNFTLSGTATGCGRSVATSDNIVFDVSVSGCSEGTVTVSLASHSGTDVAGNTGPVSASTSATITIDRTAPTITTCFCGFASGVMGNSGTGTSVTANSTGTAYLVSDSISVSTLADITSSPDNLWNSTPVSTANSAATMNPLGLSEGTYNYFVVDTAGNLSARYTTSSVTIDNVAPNAPVVSAPVVVGPNTTRPSASSNELGSVTFVNNSVSLPNPITRISVQASGNSITAVISSINTLTTTGSVVSGSTFSSGVYNAYAIDRAGNVSSGVMSVFTMDTALPVITDIYTTASSRTYLFGEVIPIFLTFNEIVTVSGFPTIRLETGTVDRTVAYASGTGTNTLRFNYTVQAGDNTLDLDVVTGSTFSTGAGDAIRDLYGNPDSIVYSYTIPKIGPSVAGSLSNLNAIAVDGIVPTVTGVNSASGNQASYSTTFTFNLDVTGFDASDITLTGTATGCSTSVSATSASVYVATYTGCSDGTIIPTIRVDAASLPSTNTGPKTAYSPGTITKDTIAPTINTFSGSVRTKATSFTWSVTFNESVSGFTIADIRLDGTATGCSGSLNASTGSTFTLTVTSCGEGTVVPTVLANTVSDAYGTTGPLADSTGQTTTVDRTGPIPTFTIPSTPTNATTLTYTITFDEFMSGLAASDFSRSGTATSCTVGTPSSSSGTTVTVSVTGCSGGTVILTLNSNAVTDGLSTAGPATAVTAATVTRDITAPTVSSLTPNVTPTNQVSPEFTLTFSEAITGLDSSDFTVAGTATGCTMTPATSTGTTITVAAVGCSAGTVTPTLKSASITDIAGNSGPATAFTGTQLTIDRTAPSAPNAPLMAAGSDTGISSSDARTTNSSVSVTVATPEATGTFAITATLNSSTVTCSGSVTSSSGTCSLTGLTEGAWSVSATFTDAAGNVSVASSTTTFNIDNTAPTVSIAAPSSPITSFPKTYTLTFSESVVGFTSSDISNAGGTATGCVFTPVSSSGTIINVSITGCSDGDVIFEVASNSVTDLAGNAGPTSAVTTSSVTIDNGPPTVTLTSATAKSTQSATVQSTKAGTAYIVRSSVSVSTLSDITGAADSVWNSVSVASANTNTSLTLAGLTDGTYKAYAIDPQNRLSLASVGSLVIDDTAPVAPTSVALASSSDSGTSNSDGITNDDTPTINVVAAENGGTVTVVASRSGQSDVTCTMTGAVAGATCDLATLSDGTWTLTATQTDTAGNISTSTTGSLVIDTVSSTVVNVSTDSGNGPFKAGSVVTVKIVFSSVVHVTTTGGTPSIKMETGVIDRDAMYASGSTTNALIFSFTVQSGDISPDLDYVSATALVANGGTITDAAGNNAVLTLAAPGLPTSLGFNRSMVIDTAAPTAPPTVAVAVASDSGSSSSDGITSVTTPTIDVTAAEAGGTMTVRATRVGQSNVQCTMSGSTSGSSCTLGVLAEGTWTVSVTQTDAAGNIGSATDITVVVDISAPVASASTQSVRSASNSTVQSTEVGTAYVVRSTVAVSALSDITFAADASWNSGAIAAASTDTSVAMTGLSEGTYVVFAVDRAGNLSGASVGTITVDNTPPVVSSFTSPASPTRVTSLAFTLVFDGAVVDLASGDFSNTGTATGCVFTPSASSGSSFTVTVTSCGEGTLIPTLRVGAVADAAGNTAPGTASSASSVTIDRTAPLAPSLTTGIITSAGNAVVQVSEASDVYLVKTSVSVSLLSDITSAAGTQWNQLSVSSISTNTNLAATGLVDGLYRAYSVDAAGNVSSASTGVLTVDSTGPVVTITASPTSVTSGGVSTITFTVDESVTGFTSSDISVGLGTLSSFSGSGSSYSAQFTASTVSGGTARITVAVGAFADAAGNTNDQTVGTLTVASPIGSNSRVSTEVNGTTYIIEQFTVAGLYNWVAPAGVTSVEHLIIGGGGGGGGGGYVPSGNGGGGGGGAAGRVLIATSVVEPGRTYGILVGRGGDGGYAGDPGALLSNGQQGTGGFLSGALNYSAPGGGGGCSSGANSSISSCSYATITDGYGGFGGANSGFNGGARASINGGGGGGGAGSNGVGGTTSTSAGGSSGAGTAASFYGTSDTFGVGGIGGAGAVGPVAGTNGTSRGNGGAGGGGGLNGSSGGAGGRGADGLVVIRYALPTITTPDLSSASDSGASTTDNLTNVTTPTFTGTAPVGATVQIKVNGTASGSPCTADLVTGAYSCVAGTIAEGTHSITATSSMLLSNGLVSSTSSALSVTIDTTAPTTQLTSATLQWGEDAAGQTTDIGTGYLVKDTVNVSNVASITSAADNVWNQVDFSSANTNMAISTSGLVSGDYKLYSVDAAGNLSAASSNFVTFVDDTTAPTPTVASGYLRAGQSAVVQSTELGTIYLVKSTIVVNSIADIGGASSSARKSISVVSANTNQNLSISGLSDGTYRAYAVDRAGNLSTASADSVVIDTVSPTVTSFTSSASSYASRSFDMTLVFSESISGLAGSDFTNVGTANGCTFSPNASSGTTFTVTVTCTSDGIAIPRLTAGSIADAAGNTGPATFAAGPQVTLGATPTQLDLTTPSIGTASGTAFTTQPVVTMKNAQGLVVTGVSGTVTATITQVGGKGALVGTATAAINTSTGTATFSDLGITGTSGTSYVITYSSGVLTSATQSVTVTVGAATKLEVATQPVGGASGAVFTTQPIVKVVDSGGNTVTSGSYSVAVGTTSGILGGTRPRVSVAGIATFTDLTFSGLASQTHTLNFTSSGLTSVSSSSFSVTAGVPTQLILVTQSVGTESGVAFSTQPVVEVRDSGGNRVPSSSVTVTASVSAGGTLEGGTTTVASSGTATFSTLGITGTSGTSYTITYSSPGLSPAVQSVTVSTGPATRVVVTTQPVGAGAGAALATQPVVSVVDSGGNVITGSNATVVVSASSGTLGGTTSLSAVSGVTAFSNLTFAGTAGTNYRLVFSSFGLQSATSSDFTVSIGAPTQLSITTQPVGSTAGAVFATTPVVKILDAGNNVVTNSSASVTATPSGGVLGGTTNRSASSGVVSFADLTFAGTINTDYTITFSSSQLPDVTSSAFRVTVGAPAKLAIVTSAASARYATAFGTQPVIEIQDAGGNRTSSTAVVTATVSAGTVLDLSGSTLTATAVNGRATFSGLGIVGAPASYGITYSSGALQTTNQSITVTKADQTITFAAPADRDFTVTPFALAPSATSNLSVTLTSTTTSVCTVSGLTITLQAIGTCSLTSSQIGNGNFNAAVDVVRSFVVSRATPRFTFPVLQDVTYGQSQFNVSVTADMPVLASFTGTSGVCTVGTPTLSSNVSTVSVSIIGAGTCSVTASRAQDATYNAGIAASGSALARTFVVNKAAGTITYNNASLTQTYDGSQRSVAVSANSGTLTVTYTGIAPTVYAPSTTPPVNAGSYAVVAVQNDNNFAATLPATLTVAKAAGAISINTGTLNQTYSGTSRSVLVASTTPASSPTIVTYTGTAGTTYGPSTFAPTNAGTYAVTAALDTTNYQATDTGTLVVGLGVQSTITIISDSTTTYGTPMTLVAVGGTGTGSMTYAAVSGPCTIASVTGVLTPTGAGPCVVTATRGASGNFGATSSAPFTVTITKAAQSVSFTSLVPAAPLPEGAYTPTAVVSSGRTPTISITSGSGTVCTLNAGVVTFVASGNCVITATEPGNPDWLAAEPVSQTLVVGRLNQSITFPTVSPKNFGDPGFTLGASASSGRVVNYSVVSGASTCSVAAGGAVTLAAVGTCVVEASQSGDDVYSPAESVRRSVVVVAMTPTAPFLSSVSANDGSATVAYAAPASDGGAPIQAYTVVVRHAGTDRSLDVVRTDCPLTLVCYIDGLTNGQTYSVTVLASNRVGTGLSSAQSPLFLPILNPQAVRSLTARAGNQTLDVAWMAPLNLGGGTFSRFEISLRARPNGYQAPISITDVNATSYRFTGLDNGTGYDVKVVTITSFGSSEFTGNTAEVYGMPRTAPSAPRDVTIVAPTGRVATVSWRVPVSDGGSAITSYITSATNSVCATTNVVDVSCRISGLTPGAPLSVEVRAVNSVGTSEAATAAINLPNRPLPPTVQSVSINESVAEIVWESPSQNGGQPVVGYLVYMRELDSQAGRETKCVTAMTSCRVVNLDPKKRYVFMVSAVNAVGESDMSKEVVTGRPTPVTVAGNKPARPTGNNTGAKQTTTSTSLPSITTTTSTTLPFTPSDDTNSNGVTNSTILWWLLALSACGLFLFALIRRHRKGEDL